MFRRFLLLGAVACALFAAADVSALTIKLGSLAPVGSPWELGIKKPRSGRRSPAVP